jgi:hypothetical protein
MSRYWSDCVRLKTPWSRVHPEQLTGPQLSKTFPTFCGTRRFITVFTSAGHLSISSARSMKFVPPHSTVLRSILILYSDLRLGLPCGVSLSGLPTHTLYAYLLSPHVLHAQSTSFFLIAQPECYFMSITEHKVHRYVVFSTFLLPRPS